MIKLGLILMVWGYDLILFLVLSKFVLGITSTWFLYGYGISLLLVAILDLLKENKITIGRIINSVVVVLLWPVVILIWLVDNIAKKGIFADFVLYDKKRGKTWWK